MPFSPAARSEAPLGLLYACGTLVCSLTLITFNKYLMHKDRFPFPVALIMTHMAVNFLLSVLFRMGWPSLFPSLTDASKKVDISPGFVIKGLFPIAACFLGALVLSNAAYSFCGITFLQFMKEGNVVLVYLFSLAFALEVFRGRTCMILVALVAGTFMTVQGELNFNLTGFTLQLVSQICETMRVVLQGVLLTEGAKLDAFTFILLVTPLSFVLLACFAAVILLHGPIAVLALPTWSLFCAWWPQLLASACTTYALNLFTASLIKQCGPIASCLTGITKDSLIVLSGSLVMGEVLSHQQVFGFLLQVSCVGLWACFKCLPELHSVALDSLPRFVLGLLVGAPAREGCAQLPRDAGSAHHYGAAGKEP